MTIFGGIEEFYAADERRRRSGEADYGARWGPGRSRVSYVHATGEVYAEGGRVVILGTVPPDPLPALYYKTLDGLLAGWPEAMMRGETLDWIRSRLTSGTGAVQ